MKNINELELLLNISNLVNSKSDIYEIVASVKQCLKNLKDINLFYYDYSAKKLKDAVNNFSVVEDMFDDVASGVLYSNFLKLSNCDFILNQKETIYSSLKPDEMIQIESILVPLKSDGSLFGMIELSFDNTVSVKHSFLQFLVIFSNHILMKIHNKLLQDRIQTNSDFYDALKNIAKIIETQYELNYIIPLIGEMIDKFISNHLIYIFIKQDSEYKLFWPNDCRDRKIYDMMSGMGREYIVSEDRKTGVFPLISGKNILGCVAARSTIDKLTPNEIDYINQLTKQSSATIERANVYAEALKHATLDALTGLNNRRQFELRLKQEYASATRQKHPLCAMMIDIDFFKKINDTYGHAAGDKVLKTVANVIKDKLREYDIPSRYGGEEFCVLLPQTKIEEANIVAQRLRAAIEKTVIETFDEKNSENKKISVTISLGLTQLNEKDSAEDLYMRADKALYEAKERGRNRVIVYEG